ncbi:MAG: LemA family protein [Victivallaceae bacterium]|nr:LemA family protein [Victivallaceae bacterium]
MPIWGIVAMAAAAFLLLIVIALRNSLIGRRNDVENAFAGIDAQLKKRCDLIPNLVAAVKTYMAHERGVLDRVTELRARALAAPAGSNERMEILGELAPAMRQIVVQAESYPELKASANFQLLQRSLNEVEEQLSAARRSFNAAVTSYNNAVEMFPTSIFAAMMGLRRRELFSIPEADREKPDVKQLFS